MCARLPVVNILMPARKVLLPVCKRMTFWF